MKERWYPGTNELGFYINTAWMDPDVLTLDQVWGQPSDLQAINLDSLTTAHRLYSSPNISVVSAGSGDPTLLHHLLASVATDPKHRLPKYQANPHWANQTYHETSLRDESRFTLRYGCIIRPLPKPVVLMALSFILEYLTNYVHGPL